MEQALARNPDIAALLVELFHAGCDPNRRPTRDADRGLRDAHRSGA